MPSRSPRNRVANLTGPARRFGHCQNENLARSYAQYCNCLDYFATSERRVSHSSVRVRHVSNSYVVFMLANIYSLKQTLFWDFFQLSHPVGGGGGEQDDASSFILHLRLRLMVHYSPSSSIKIFQDANLVLGM